MWIVAVLLFALPAWADLTPSTWGALKFSDLDRLGDLDLKALAQDPAFTGKPIILEGSYRGGNYRRIIYSWLVVPPVVTSIDSRLMNPAYAVGLGRWSFAADGDRLFQILDVIYDQCDHFAEGEKPPVMLFMLEAVASRYRWNHVRYERGTAAHHDALRMAVDYWRFQRGQRD